MEAITTAFIGAIVLCVSFIVLLMRLPPRMSVWILNHRLFVDSMAFIGTFLLLSSFSNSFVALITGGFMGLMTTGFLEANHHWRFVERLMVFVRKRNIKKIRKVLPDARTKDTAKHLLKRCHKLEKALLLAEQRLEDPT